MVRFLRERLEKAGCAVGDNFFKAVTCDEEMAGAYVRREGVLISLFSLLLLFCIFISVETPLCSYAGYMVSIASLSHRLGCLYCLYCLYETQPFYPSVKVYLSLGMTIFHLKKQLC